MRERTLPLYGDLENGTSRAVFGPDDDLGCLNLLTPERVRSAAGLVREGRVVSLNAPLSWPDPAPLFSLSGRGAPQHHIVRRPTSRDDYLDGFYPQSGTQWDGFLHVLDPETQSFYNRRTDESVGIELWADRGIVGRGVLLDAARFAAEQGRLRDWRERPSFSATDLEACAAAENVEITEGTILVIRVGWEAGWNAATPEERQSYVEDERHYFGGLEGSLETVERLWNWGVAAVASDSVTLEAYPVQGRYIHVDLLARLGIPIGEMWALEALAATCAELGRYDFMLTSAPLNIQAGIGSTANALAIF